MPFFILLLVVDAIATVACVIKGRFLSALLGVAAIGSAIWAFIDIENYVPLSNFPDLAYGFGVFVFVSFPLTGIVVLGALRHPKPWSYWVAKKEDLRMAKVDKLVAEAGEHLDPDEQVLAWVGGHTVRDSVLIATDQRLVFYWV